MHPEDTTAILMLGTVCIGIAIILFLCLTWLVYDGLKEIEDDDSVDSVRPD